MSSILTNNGAATALGTLREINKNLGETQSRISTGLKVRSGKDNAAYFSIAKTMDGDSGMYSAVNEGMTLAKNSVSTSRMGAEKIVDLTQEFADRVAFAQNDTANKEDVQKELREINERIKTTIEQSTFNGHSLIKRASSNLEVVTGIKRDGGFDVSTMTVDSHNLSDLVTQNNAALGTEFGTDISAMTAGQTEMFFAAGDFDAAGLGAATTGGFNLHNVAEGIFSAGTGATSGQMADYLKITEKAIEVAIGAATDLGVKEKTLETQQSFLTDLTDQLDSGIGSMVDANMENEAARLQALQVQQQLAVQSLSIANQAPQQILSLFR